MMSEPWSPLLVIRPDGNDVLLEDSQTARTTRKTVANVVSDILSGSSSLGGRDLWTDDGLDDTSKDWVDNGWRPSLDYFNWSEQATEHPVAPDEYTVTASAPSAPRLNNPALKTWDWSGEEPREVTSGSVGELLMRRRTVRQYQEQPLDLTLFAQVLRDFAFLTSDFEPLGSMVGIRLAAIVYSIENVEAGIWDLDIQRKRATQRSSGVSRQELADLMCGMQAPMTASATVVFIVDFPTRQERFPYERGLRELYIEVARISQKFILAAESHGCGALITPATNDNALSDLLGLSEEEAPVYTITFGRKPAAK